MISERVSTIAAKKVAPTIMKMFMTVGPNKFLPVGMTVYKIGINKFSAVRALESGGKLTTVLEIVDGLLRPAGN